MNLGRKHPCLHSTETNSEAQGVKELGSIDWSQTGQSYWPQFFGESEVHFQTWPVHFPGMLRGLYGLGSAQFLRGIRDLASCDGGERESSPILTYLLSFQCRVTVVTEPPPPPLQPITPGSEQIGFLKTINCSCPPGEKVLSEVGVSHHVPGLQVRMSWAHGGCQFRAPFWFFCSPVSWFLCTAKGGMLMPGTNEHFFQS